MLQSGRAVYLLAIQAEAPVAIKVAPGAEMPLHSPAAGKTLQAEIVSAQPYTATMAGDCNDSDPTVHPGAPEVCNLKDDNCDGTIDEGVKSTFYADVDGDGYGDASSSTAACSAPAGTVADATDCDDATATVHPGATEACNGIDDDCDTLIDEGVQTTFYRDADGDGFGNPNVTSTCGCGSSFQA